MGDLDTIVKVLRESRELLLATHVVADGDCLGSMLAAYLAFNGNGRRIWAVHPEPVPQVYRFLPGWEKIIHPSDLSSVPPVAIVLDCTDPERAGREVCALLEKVPLVVNIDHHAGNQYFGHLNYVRPQAAATAELVYQVLEASGSRVSPAVALALYTGLVTDTGCFQYENTSPATHRLAARLLEAGVAPEEVHRHLWEEKPLATLRLLGKVLPTLRLAADGRVAWLTVTQALLEEAGAGQEHCEGLVEYPRSLAGVEVALLFREVGPNQVKVGFRSKRQVDVNLLAARFGGGGHRRAAGCTVFLPLEEAVRVVVGAAVDAVQGEVGDGFSFAPEAAGNDLP